jgi:hypothetical protein
MKSRGGSQLLPLLAFSREPGVPDRGPIVKCIEDLAHHSIDVSEVARPSRALNHLRQSVWAQTA